MDYLSSAQCDNIKFLRDLVASQIEKLYWISDTDNEILKQHCTEAFEKSLLCINEYNIDNIETINPLYGDHYIIYLWFLSNLIYRKGIEGVEYLALSDKLYLVIKSLFGCELWGGGSVEKCI